HGTYLAHNFVAAEQYPALGQKAFNERRTWSNIIYNNSLKRLEGASNSGLFTIGDLILVNDSKLFNVKKVVGNNIELIEHSKTYSINITVSPVNVEIIRSGKANRLNESAGNLVVYG